MCGQLFTSIIVASSWIDRYIKNTRNYYSRLFTNGNQGRLIVVQYAKSLQPKFYMLLIFCDSGVSLCWLVIMCIYLWFIYDMHGINGVLVWLIFKIFSGGSTTENLILEEIESLKKANEKDKADLMTQLNNQLQNEKAAYEEMFRKQKQEMRQIRT